MDSIDVLISLELGNYVEYSLIDKHLGIEFKDCMNKFDLGRFVRWSKTGNGQDVTVAFKNKGCDGLYCLTEKGLVLTKDL
jgi:hypothetical protein